jgi:hypothetical protein
MHQRQLVDSRARNVGNAHVAALQDEYVGFLDAGWDIGGL